MKRFDSFQDAYRALICDVMDDGIDTVINGKEVRELMPYEFCISHPRDRMLNLKCRKQMYRYIFGELLWYLSGSDDMTYIRRYAKYWEEISDDGVHSNSAYGKYIFGDMSVKGEGVNYKQRGMVLDKKSSQWEWCKNLLQKDPTTRQAVINVKPVQMYETKDTVCTFYLHFILRDGLLDLHVGMRSNDLIRGTTYDVFMFTFLQELMASELDVGVGSYYHHANNLHIYHSDFTKVKEILQEYRTKRKPYMMNPIPVGFRTLEVPSLLEIEKHLHNLNATSKDLVLMALKGDDFCGEILQ